MRKILLEFQISHYTNLANHAKSHELKESYLGDVQAFKRRLDRLEVMKIVFTGKEVVGAFYGNFYTLKTA